MTTFAGQGRENKNERGFTRRSFVGDVVTY